MSNYKEKVKLDEVLKYLFSTSDKVLIKLLNGVFEEEFNEEEVDLKVTNNEFIEDSLDVIRGDMFFEIDDSYNNKKVHYHLEFQTKNDNTMVVRMFEYGFKKGKENSINNKDNTLKTIYFPKQKVIFFEENKNIKNSLNMKIVFPNEQEVLYSVDVMKYWELNDEYLIKRKMYPLIPLQLFNLRKELEKSKNKSDLYKMKELSYKAKTLATKLSNESKDLFDSDEILGEDFHKMLLSIQNLIEYLNRNYLNDDKLEEEVNTMTKSLYDPEVEKNGIQKGIKQGEKNKAIEIAKSLLDVLDVNTIALKTGLSIDEVNNLKGDITN